MGRFTRAFGPLTRIAITALVIWGACHLLRSLYHWICSFDATSIQSRSVWILQLIRLLILTARVPHGRTSLDDRERLWIARIALAEAKRKDRPEEPKPEFGMVEISQFIEANAQVCPGAQPVLDFLASERGAPLRTTLLRQIWMVVVADGSATHEELEWLQSVAGSAGLTQEQFLQVASYYYRVEAPHEALLEARTSLGLPASATEQEIRKAFTAHARGYHPDAHATASPSLRRLAAERFSKLREARDLLLSSVGHGRLVAMNASSGQPVGQHEEPVRILCFHCCKEANGVAPPKSMEARCESCLSLLYLDPEIAGNCVPVREESDQRTERTP